MNQGSCSCNLQLQLRVAFWAVMCMVVRVYVVEYYKSATGHASVCLCDAWLYKLRDLCRCMFIY